MPDLAPASLDAATAVVRALGATAHQLEPVKAVGKARNTRTRLSDAGVMEQGLGLSSDVRLILESALCCLSPPQMALPLADCLPVLKNVPRADRYTAKLPPRSPPPSFASLPVELVACIVEFCQEDDVRARQATNLALARTCRTLYRTVAPVLAAEMHLFSPGQVERAASCIAGMSDSTVAVKNLTVDVALPRLDSAAGRRIGKMVDKLTTSRSLKTFHLHVRPPQHPQLDSGMYEAAVRRALGGATWLSGLAQVEDLHLPISPDFSLYAPPAGLRRLQLGVSSPPLVPDPGQLRLAREAFEEAGTAPPEYEVLALPFHSFYADDLLPLVLPPSLPAPILTHLEATFYLDDPGPDCEVIAHTLRELAPSLRRLAVRFQYTQPDAGDFEELILPALHTCTKLEHLELGGLYFEHNIGAMQDDVSPMESFMQVVWDLDHLETLVILPNAVPPFDETDYHTLRARLQNLPPSLRKLVLYAPDPSSANPDAPPPSEWNMLFIVALQEECERSGVVLEIRVDAKEDAWVRVD
ncbi:hypothetical protein JCM8097_008833 [Rhodosporidiobolus ruineniae]